MLASPTITDVVHSEPANEGSPVTVTVNATDPNTTTLSYGFDWNDDGDFFDGGDIESQSSNQAPYTWNDDASYTLRVYVYGDGTISTTHVVTVGNVAPSITSLTNTGPVDEGLAVTVVVTATDPSTDTLAYSFDWDDDGTYDISGQPSNQASHTWNDDGTYGVAVRVDDGDGGMITDTTTVTVNDTGPTADFHADVTSGVEPLTVQFTDDSTAHDTVTAWQWNFGDGSPITTTQHPGHQYLHNGVYTVSLTVWDADGSSDAVVKTEYITVTDTGPSADFSATPTSGDESLNVSFSDASTAYDNITTWDWDLDGDGASDSDAENPAFIYDASGIYTVSLTVWDADGSSDGATKTEYITVNNVPPTAVINSPPTQMAGLDVNLDGSNSTEPGQDITAYEWDLDDDGQYDDGSGPTAVVNLTVTGLYTVGLRVTDEENSTDTEEASFTIQAAPLDHFVVSVPPTSTAGVGFMTVITAEDEYGNVITDWDQDVTLSTNGSDIQPTVALGSQFSDGVWNDLVTLTTAGNGRTATAGYDGHTGQDTLDIEPADATQFTFSSFSDPTAGQEIGFLLTARDPYGNVDVDYVGSHTLAWGGLNNSPGDDEPDYPSLSPFFIQGVASNLDFTAYEARTNVVLTVAESGGPSGATDPFTVTHALPVEFLFSAIPDQVAGTSGAFTITVRDVYENTATGYTGNHSLSWSGLGTSPGSQAPAYPNPVNFSGGIAASQVFTPYLAEADVRLEATEGSISGMSNLFDVSVGSTVGEVVVRSAAGGAGDEVTTHDMVVYNTFTVYAAGYDAWGNYVTDPSSVTWSGTGVAQDQLDPTTGSSTVLTPIISGTGTIVAAYSGSITDATGLITVRAPVLEVTLSDSVPQVEAGETLTYTIAYTNAGNADATNTVLTLDLDGYVAYVSDSVGSSGSTHMRTWNLATVGAGGFGQVIVTGTVDSPLDNNTILTSVVEIDSDQTDVVSDDEGTIVHSQPVLHIAKSDLPDPVQAGGSIVYTIEFSNTGNMNATNVVITDVIPTNTSWSASPGGALDPTESFVTWDVGTVAPGQTPYRTLIVQVDSPLPSGTVITNTGYQIASDQTAPVSGPDVTTAVLSPTLTLSQTGNPGLVDAGSLVTFTIAYSNTGSGGATGVVITDVVPQHANFVWASDDYDLSGGQVIWDIGLLPKLEGGEVEVVFRVTSPLTDGTPILNQVTIDSSETDSATYLDAVFVRSEVELHVTKMAGSDPVPAGDALIYTIAFTNTGNASATGVVVTDVLPAHTTFASASDGGTYDDGIVTWNLGLLAGKNLAGQDGTGSVTLVVTVTSPLTSGTELQNKAFIACAEDSGDQVSVRTDVTSLPDLHVEVSDSSDPVQGDSTLVYTIVYANDGNANATAVRLRADYDARLSFVGADPPPTSGDDFWNLPLLPGEGGTGTVVVTLTTPALAPEAVLNSTFHVRSAEVGWASASEATQAEAVDLGLSVGYDDNVPYPGKRITYTVHYTNTGDVPAQGVVLTVQRPQDTTYVGLGWTHIGGGNYRFDVGSPLNPGANGSVQFIVDVSSTPDGERLPSGFSSLEPTFSIADDGQSGPEFYTSNNQSACFIGVPDLVIDEIRVTPEHPTPERSVTITVVVRNQGTGMAWNPNSHTGFWVDLFIDPEPVPASYPWNGDGDRFLYTTALAPGATRDIVFVLPDGLSDQYHEVYAKVDNFRDPNLALWQQNSLVPESDEENNVTMVPVIMGEPDDYTIFLPAVMRNQ